MSFAPSVLSMPQARDAVRHPVVLALRGWVCDRYTDAGMRGSLVLAEAAAARLQAPLLTLGEPEPAADLDWRQSLAKATPYLTHVAAHIDGVMARHRTPMIFANRCGASLATIAAALRHRPDMKVVWIDAHGDFNTPTSTPTGYLGGMVLTALCGLWDSGFGAGLAPERIVLAGQRDLDAAEIGLIAEHGVRLVEAPHGALDPVRLAAAVAGAPIWLHIDADVVDPRHLPAEYRVAGGLHPDDLRAAIAALLETSELVGFELTEFESPPDETRRLRARDAIMTMIAPALDAVRRGA